MAAVSAPVRRLIAAVFKESFGRLKRVAFEQIHATRFKFLFHACRYRKTLCTHWHPEGMLLRDKH
jgi:hypothetical protein